MRLFIPTASEAGLRATISDHFGSAPVFAIFGGDGSGPRFQRLYAPAAPVSLGARPAQHHAHAAHGCGCGGAGSHGGPASHGGPGAPAHADAHDHAHGKGGCSSGWRRLGITSGDVVICRQIGAGALRSLLAAGVQVLRTDDPDLAAVLRSYAGGRLEPFSAEEVHNCGETHQ